MNDYAVLLLKAHQFLSSKFSPYKRLSLIRETNQKKALLNGKTYM